MAEWFKAPVLKTGEPKGSVGSNPTPSAMPHAAKAHHRSMNREVVTILERELERPGELALPQPVGIGQPIDHYRIVQSIRDARDGKR